ncbi:MAG: cell division protein FtsL [Methyloprofundus sp.]|nr:cell division protein FtsL [Methyloprofundus sp.]MBW6453387.1 cell division protein FtsL [Methyloprofundus sp.]
MERMFVVVLLIMLLGSGLAVIYAKYNSRLVFIEIQKSEQELDRLEVLWGRLTLEERMLAEHNRVEETARKSMGLVELDRKSIVYIKL